MFCSGNFDSSFERNSFSGKLGSFTALQMKWNEMEVSVSATMNLFVCLLITLREKKKNQNLVHFFSNFSDWDDVIVLFSFFWCVSLAPLDAWHFKIRSSRTDRVRAN